MPEPTLDDWEAVFTAHGMLLDSEDGAHQMRQSLTGAGVTLADVSWFVAFVRETMPGLESPPAYCEAKMRQPRAFAKQLTKSRAYAEAKQLREEAGSTRNHQREGEAQKDRRLQREFVVASLLERRTVDWCMRKEHVNRSVVIGWLAAEAPYKLTERMYEGAEDWRELPDDITENWRLEGEADTLKTERGALFQQRVADEGGKL